ncbi:MAG: 3-methyladenine DNA glycosylase [Leucobacter sp.]|nr:3-methyladenine DNA glycosylase [Leucobacter sp.]
MQTEALLVQSRQPAPLSASTWRTLEASHRARVEGLTAAHLARKANRERHPIEDFLWTYYSVTPAELRRWHPGAGVVLEGADPQRTRWRYYTQTEAGMQINLPLFFEKRGKTVNYVERLLSATLARTPKFGCFGLHEWAMVYRLRPDEVRHMGLPLRLGHAATDAVVDTHPITCSHFDAYRFFTPAATHLNTLTPTRETQPDLEQPGCLHAGMDVYKWATKLTPIVPSELVLDCFEFARDIREVDMRASPYDVSGYRGANGDPLTPILVETPGGKREYATLQAGFAERGNKLRVRVLEAITVARELHG